jgi:uncharacterized RDD family membrane protein YckC
MQDESLEYAGPGIGTGASLVDTVVLPSLAVIALWAGFEPNRQGRHDRLAGAVVARSHLSRSFRPC